MYLRLEDYDRIIQPTLLAQLLNGDDNLRIVAEQVAQAEAIGYLQTKYDVTEELTDTLKFNYNDFYTSGSRVYITADEYVDTISYTHNQMAKHGGNIYRCTSNGTVTGAWNPALWLLVGMDKAMFYVPYINSNFDAYKIYKVGDVIFYKGSNYVCQIGSPMASHQSVVNALDYSNTSDINIFPDDENNGESYWSIGVPFEVYNIFPNSVPFVSGDNRNAKLVDIILTMALYHLHMRVAPQNIPALRIMNYMGRQEEIVIKEKGTTYPSYSALGWMQACVNGLMQPNLKVLQPNTSKVMWGGSTKVINIY
jgi:hypothetical protein